MHSRMILSFVAPLAVTLALVETMHAQVPAYEWAKQTRTTTPMSLCASGRGVATDRTGNCYVTGYFYGQAIFDSTNLTSAGGTDAFLAKYSTSGVLQWFQQVGGSLDDGGEKVATDATGNCYLLGGFQGTVNFGVTNLTSAGGYDIFIAKFDPTGLIRWVQQIGGTDADHAGGIAVDAIGNCYVTGSFLGNPRFATTNLSGGSRYDVFVAKYDTFGGFQWTRQAGGTNHDAAYGVGVDAEGSCYISGSFYGPASFGSITLHGIAERSSDIFVAKLDRNGVFQWARAAGQSNDDGSSGLAVDSSGNCYVVGTTVGAIFGSLFVNGHGREDAFVAKYDTDGIVEWVRLIGGPNYDYGQAVAVDKAGNCYVSGDFQETADFGGTNLTSVGLLDVFIAKYDRSGTLQWAQSGGGGNTDQGFGIAVDDSLNVYQTGVFVSSSTFGSFTLTSPICDAFVLKRPKRPPVVTLQPQSQTIIAGSDATFTAAASSLSPLSFQWSRNGVILAGRTTAGLTIVSGQLADVGTYAVIISNSDGSVTSAPVSLNVEFSLATTTTGQSTVMVSPSQSSYQSNTTVVLTATASPGSAFANWSGDASATNNPLTVTMNSNKVIRANFVPNALTIGIQGQGTVIKSPDKPFYGQGEQLALSAVPARWFSFSRWGDGVTNNPRLISIGAANTYTAIFSPTTDLETLTFGNVSRIAPVGMPAIFVGGVFVLTGSVTRISSGEIAIQSTFPNGSVYYSLDGSEPSFASRSYEGVFTLRHSASIRALAYDANFTRSWESDPVQVLIIPTYSLNATTAGGGTVGISPAIGPYLNNSLVTLTARPSAGWTFLQWLGDANGVALTNTIVMNRNKCLQAVFGTGLDTVGSGSGSVLVEPVASLYPYGFVAKLAAVPQPGHYFGVWGNAAKGTNNPLRFVVTNANETVSALFAPLSAGQYALTVVADGFGTVTNKPRGTRFTDGTVITLTALPDPSQQFLGWAGDASGTQNPLSVTLNQSKVITAQFTKRPTLAVQPCSEPALEDGFQFLLTGEFGGRYQVEKNDAWQGWSPLATVTNIYGTLQFNDAGATNQGFRAYRARIAP